MSFKPKAVESLILATLALHKVLMISSLRSISCPAGLADTGDANRELKHSNRKNDACVQSMLPLES